MGLCRALVYLATGAAVSGEIRFALIAGAIALAAHVIGLTYAAKQENLNRGRPAVAACHSGRPSAVCLAGHFERMACRHRLCVVVRR